MKKKFLLCAALFALSLSAAEKKEQKAYAAFCEEHGKALISPQRCLNLILFLDTGAEQIGGPLTNGLAIALKQKAAPIIISETVLYNFFALRQSCTPQAMQRLEGMIKENQKQLEELQRHSAETHNPKELENIDRSFESNQQKLEQDYESVMDLVDQLNKPLLMKAESAQELSYLSKLVHMKIEQLPEGPIKSGFVSMAKILNKLSELLQRDLSKRPISEARSSEEVIAAYREDTDLLNSYSQAASQLHEMLGSISANAFERYRQAMTDLEHQYRIASMGFQTEFYKKQGELFKKMSELLPLQRKIKERETALFYRHVQFDFSEWLIFKHPANPLYLLIPKSYIAHAEKELLASRPKAVEKETKKERESYSNQELAVGLAFEHGTVLQKLPSSITSEDALLRFMTEHMHFKMGIEALREGLPEQRSINVKAIQECFIPKQHLTGAVWNIYLEGHGMHKTVWTVAQQLQFSKESFQEAYQTELLLGHAIAMLPESAQNPPASDVEKFNKEMNRLFSVYLILTNQNVFDPSGDTASLFLQMFLEQNPLIIELINDNAIDPIIENRSLLRIFLKVFRQQIDKIKHELVGQQMKLEGMLKSGQPTEVAPIIAGLSLEQIKIFLTFLNGSKEGADCSFLYITTCFGGGFNAEQIRRYLVALHEQEKRSLNQVSPSCIVAMGAVSDAAVYSFNVTEKLIPLNFDGFFNDLKKFFTREEILRKDPLITILKNVLIRARGTEAIHGLSDVPLVYIPGTGMMKAVEVDKEIIILTHAKLKALELILPKKKEKIEPINTQGKSGLLFYPTTINVPVHLGVDSQGHATALVPMAPDASMFNFKSIETGSINLLTFLKESIAHFRSVMPRRFAINELTTSNYLDSGLPGQGLLKLYDVRIQSTVTTTAEIIDWNISFMLFDEHKKELFYQGVIKDSYEDAKKLIGRTITNPEWKQMSKEEFAAAVRCP